MKERRYYDEAGKTIRVLAGIRSQHVHEELARLQRERDEALDAAEKWSRELREQMIATGKAVQEKEEYQHARDLLHDEAEEARAERDRLLAALLWIEGAGPGDGCGVTIHHEQTTGVRICRAVRVESGARRELARAESVVAARLTRCRLPLVLQTIEEFIRQEEANA